MSIFKNKFLSASGQKERIKNVGATLKAAVTGKGVQANTKSEGVNKVLSAAASNPYTTAAIVAGGAYVAKTGVKATATQIASSVSKASTGTKIGLAIATPIAISVAVSNPKTIKKVAETPSNLANFGGNVASVKSWEDVKDVAVENPVISGLVAGGTAFIVGKTVTNAATSLLNTQAIKENTAISKDLALNTSGLIGTTPNDLYSSSVPITPQTQVLGKSAGTTTRKYLPNRKKQNNQMQMIRLTINNQNKNTKYLKLNR